MGTKIKIACIDDECLFIDGLVLLLNTNPDLQVVQTANCVNEIIEKLQRSTPELIPDIALIDIQMKPKNGFDLVESLRVQFPTIKIIILSSHYKSAVLGSMIKLGISAFVPKYTSADGLFQSILSVYNTGVYFTLSDHQMITSFLNTKSKGPFLQPLEKLSKREIEVLTLVCTEMSNQEIADKLYISKRTVESHRQHLLEKIGTKSTIGLVIYALCNQIYIPDYKHFDCLQQ